MVALTNARAPEAFGWFLRSLALRQGGNDPIGEAKDHACLARAARVESAWCRAVVLGGRAVVRLEGLKHRYDLLHILKDLMLPLIQMEERVAGVAALRLAWFQASEIGDPVASSLAVGLEQLRAGVSLADVLDPEKGRREWSLLGAAIARAEKRLQIQGINPYSPLPEGGDPA
jgi:hypothetical protein